VQYRFAEGIADVDAVDMMARFNGPGLALGRYWGRHMA